MPVTQLDERTALVTIDLQKMLRGLPLVCPLGEVVAKANRLAAAVRACELPVVRVRLSYTPDFGEAPNPRADSALDESHLPDAWDEYLDELDIQPGDLLVTKRSWSGFYGTDLDLQLRHRGITGIVICGVATAVGVESTARAAFERGYNLTIASDAVTDISAETHENSLTRIFPLLAEVDTTEAIIAKLTA